MEPHHDCPTPGRCRCTAPIRPSAAEGLVTTRAGVAAVKTRWSRPKARKKMDWNILDTPAANQPFKTDRRSWLNVETFYMLKIFKDNGIAMKLLNRREQMYTYKNVQRIMALKGYHKTPDQIRIKWKHLKAFYYDARRRGCPDSFPYYGQLDALLEPLLQAGHRDNSSDESPDRDADFWSEIGPKPGSSATLTTSSATATTSSASATASSASSSSLMSSSATSETSLATQRKSSAALSPRRVTRSAARADPEDPDVPDDSEPKPEDVEWLDVEHMKQERNSDDEQPVNADPISIGTSVQPQRVQVELVRLPKPVGGHRLSQPLAGPRPMFNLVRQAAPLASNAPAGPRPMRLLLVQKGMEVDNLVS